MLRKLLLNDHGSTPTVPTTRAGMTRMASDRRTEAFRRQRDREFLSADRGRSCIAFAPYSLGEAVGLRANLHATRREQVCDWQFHLGMSLDFGENGTEAGEP